MKTLEILISEKDYKNYDFNLKKSVKFSELVEKISLEYAKQSLLRCNEIAKEVGLSEMTFEEINAEIQAVRDAKNNN